MTDTPYPIDLNTPYESVECQYAVLSSQNTLYCLEEHIRCLDCRIQYDVLGRRVDTLHPTGGYAVSGSVLDRVEFRGADVAKISRKRLKPEKHEPGNERARKEPGESYQKVYTSPSTLIGGDPRKNDTVDMKEAQGNKAYTLEVLTKEAQPVTITDCHVGNPCEQRSDLTAKSSSLIIEGMYGQDLEERVTDFGA
ncbi:hypothetical protein Tco_0140770 [Tanacetum coccineum]